MSQPAQTYAAVTIAVDKLIRTLPSEVDSARLAYLVARAALLHGKRARGPLRAAETAYQLADELAMDASL